MSAAKREHEAYTAFNRNLITKGLVKCYAEALDSAMTQMLATSDPYLTERCKGEINILNRLIGLPDLIHEELLRNTPEEDK
jgi:hypothetical protein